MTRKILIHAAAALIFIIAPYATAEQNDQTIPLEPIVRIEASDEDSFFSPKSADEIQNLAVIDEELEESLVWDKQGS